MKLIYLKQIKVLTFANMKSRYRKTLAGFFWVILNPLLMFGAQSLVFKKFLHIQVPNYLTFLFSGLLPWIFLVSTIDMCTTIFENSRDYLKSYAINPLIVLLSQIFDNLINFLAAFFVLIIPLSIYQVKLGEGIFFFPLSLVILLFGLFSISWLLAILQVFFHDVKFVVQFMISILFFLTPIFYPRSYVPEAFRWLIDLNPFYALIEPFQIVIYKFSMASYLKCLLKSFAVSLFFFIIAYKFWKSKKHEFYLSI